jgi:hypothetical protein
MIRSTYRRLAGSASRAAVILVAPNAMGLALGIAAASLALPASPRAQLPSTLSVKKADDWTALFDRHRGWTGADGIFAIPLTGYEGPDHAAGAKTLFVFSDTFIGEVDATGARKNSTMINNSMAILDGAQPDSNKIKFIWGGTGLTGTATGSAGAASAFIPNLPSTEGKKAWYWLQDGFCHKGVVYNLPLIVEPNPDAEDGWKFKETGIALIRIPLGANGEPDMAKATQKETPLYHTGAKTFYFGCGIFANTAEAGAPDPDDSVYVYGRNALYVARVKADEFEDFAKWRYWDGKGWSADIDKAASLGLGGPELSVMPITQGALKGKFVLLSSMLGPDLYVRIGDSPVGPFGNAINIYKAPEWDTGVPIYTYNAKAHPSISSNGDWIVTYNVNTSNWTRNLADADIYRPRFLRLRFDPASAILLPRNARPIISNTSLEMLTDGSWSGYRLDGRLAPNGRPAQGVLIPRENAEHAERKEDHRPR